MSDDSRDGRPLLELYDKHFEVVAADTPELLTKAHALRYQVYCVEHAFLDPAAQTNDEEWDLYDAHSAHAVLISKIDNDVVGCMRLVLPDPEGTTSLPLRELLAQEQRDQLDTLGRHRTAEISRYAISKRYRRRPGESLYPDVGWNPSPTELRRLMPHMSLGLIRGTCLLGAQHGVDTVCAAMAPALLRLLDRLGLEFEPLGPMIEYHGMRQPCVARGPKVLAGMAARQPDYFEVVSQVSRVPSGGQRSNS